MATDLLTQKSVMTQKVTKTVFDPATLCVLSATQSAPHRVTLCVLSATQCPVSSMLLIPDICHERCERRACKFFG